MHVKVRVNAGSKKEHIQKIDEYTHEISVKEPAERNQANARVLELVAEIYDVPIGRVQIITGHHAPNKILFIRNDY